MHDALLEKIVCHDEEEQKNMEIIHVHSMDLFPSFTSFLFLWSCACSTPCRFSTLCRVTRIQLKCLYCSTLGRDYICMAICSSCIQINEDWALTRPTDAIYVAMWCCWCWLHAHVVRIVSIPCLLAKSLETVVRQQSSSVATGSIKRMARMPHMCRFMELQKLTENTTKINYLGYLVWQNPVVDFSCMVCDSRLTERWLEKLTPISNTKNRRDCAHITYSHWRSGFV
jgi:hypothetical protein